MKHLFHPSLTSDGGGLQESVRESGGGDLMDSFSKEQLRSDTDVDAHMCAPPLCRLMSPVCFPRAARIAVELAQYRARAVRAAKQWGGEKPDR